MEMICETKPFSLALRAEALTIFFYSSAISWQFSVDKPVVEVLHPSHGRWWWSTTIKLYKKNIYFNSIK